MKEQIKVRLKKHLIYFARLGKVLIYEEAALPTGYPPYAKCFTDLLDEVEKEIYAQYSVSISSMIVKKSSGIPGLGYFKKAVRDYGKTMIFRDEDVVSEEGLLYWAKSLRDVHNLFSVKMDDPFDYHDFLILKG